MKKKKNNGYYPAALAAAIAVIAIVAVVVIIAAVNARRAEPTGEPTETETTTSEPTSPKTAPVTPKTTAEPTAPETSEPTKAEPTAPATAEPTSPVTSEPTKAEPTYTSEPVIPPVIPPYTDASVLLGKTADAGMEYVEKIVFLGDSTTFHMLSRDEWDNYTGSPLADGNHKANVWSGTANTLTLQYVNDPNTKIIYYDTNEELTIVEAAAKKKPEILCITLGINGVLYMPEAYFKAVYSTLVKNVQAASPDTVIILNSMFPIQEFYDATIPQANVIAGNRWIYEMAVENGCYFLNSYECLTDEKGFLPLEYSKGDGVHLSNLAYEILFDYIRTHAVPGYAE